MNSIESLVMILYTKYKYIFRKLLINSFINRRSYLKIICILRNNNFCFNLKVNVRIYVVIFVMF